MHGPRFALAFDIGGTSLRVGLFSIPKLECIDTDYAPTPKGKPALVEGTINAAQHICSQHLINKQDIGFISLGVPGNILDDGSMAPGSAENLGVEPGEFDGFNLKNALSHDVQKLWPNAGIFVQNDALAQCLGAYLKLRDNSPNGASLGFAALDDSPGAIGTEGPTEQAGSTGAGGRTEGAAASSGLGAVGYIGLGTGLGGAFLNTSSPLSFFTDGHIFDIILPEYSCIIEDILSHRRVIEKTGVSPIELNQNDTRWAKHKSAIEDMGVALGKLIIALKTNSYNKRAKWLEPDKTRVAHVNTYLIGGSLGTKGKIGKTILNQAKKEVAKFEANNHPANSQAAGQNLGSKHTIKQNGITSPIQLIQIPDPDNAAIFGSAAFLTQIYKVC